MEQTITRGTLTIAEAAVRLGISPWSAYQRARSGEVAPGVPVLRIGRRLVVPRGKLERALGETPMTVAG